MTRELPLLMPLQIPNGWAVLDNKFYDTEPILAERWPAWIGDRRDEPVTWISNSGFGFSEDVLWIRQVGYDPARGGYVCAPDNYWSIDLGWTPDADINGAYQAVLDWIADGQDFSLREPVALMRSRDRFEIQALINGWLRSINDNLFAPPVR